MILDRTMLTDSVLIVDDDIEALGEMVDALQDYGLEVHAASNGDTALKLANERRPEFILLDYLLHGTTGLELASAIRKFLPEVQIILISGYENLNALLTPMNGGAIAVLQKPLSIDSIARFIGNKLDNKNQQLKLLGY